MKKIVRTFITAVFGALLLGGVASAQVITNTGPGSNNQVTTSSSVDCDVKSTNSATINNSTHQTSNSGSASSSGNTSGGSATSGSASNSSSTSTSVTAQNSNSCLPNKDKPTPGNPGGGGQGAGGEVLGAEVGGLGAGEGELVASLPATGSTTGAEYALGTLAVLSAVAAIGYVAHQRFVKSN